MTNETAPAEVRSNDGLSQSTERKLLAGLQSLKVLLGTDSPEVRGWMPAVQQEAQRLLNAAISIEVENELLRRAWEDTRTQRDELLAHIAGKAPLPQWAAEWLMA